jgi:hypothetical protein
MFYGFIVLDACGFLDRIGFGFGFSFGLDWIWFSVFRLDWIFGFLGLDVFAGFVR